MLQKKIPDFHNKCLIITLANAVSLFFSEYYGPLTTTERSKYRVESEFDQIIFKKNYI